MKKKRIGLKILLTILSVIVLIVLSCQLILIRKPQNGLSSFDNVIGESVSSNSSRIVDIALLGAHDAFSDGINRESEPDYNDGGIVTNKYVNMFGKGLVVRLSRAQNESAMQMLYSGVRYFDVRITKVGDEYYGYHGYLSYTLDYYLKDIVEFLYTHSKEYIIFDIQHFYTEDGGNYSLGKDAYDDLVTYMSNVKYEGLSIMDYVNYETTTSIGELTYGDVTENGTKAGVVMLAKVEGSNIMYKRDGDASNEKKQYSSCRSYWINRNGDEDMINGINAQASLVKEHGTYNDILRVNQAQKTGFITDITLVRSLVNWSLINLADNFNPKLVEDETRLKGWLEAMPILMVDYATSKKGNFNSEVNRIIKEYNIEKGY